MAKYYNDGVSSFRTNHFSPRQAYREYRNVEFSNGIQDLKLFKKEFPEREGFIEHFMSTTNASRQQAEQLWFLAEEVSE